MHHGKRPEDALAPAATGLPIHGYSRCAVPAPRAGRVPTTRHAVLDASSHPDIIHWSSFERETSRPTSILQIMKSSERDKLIAALKARFEKNMHRHRGTAWAAVQARLDGNPD